MSVQRFRSFDEARRALRTRPGDPNLPRRIASLWKSVTEMTPLDIPRGVRKFRSIEEALEERKRWTSARIAKLAAQRQAVQPPD